MNVTAIAGKLAVNGSRKMDWKTPRDGKEFVGFVAGSRRDTRDAFGRVFLERYGIRMVKHIGHEHRKEVSSLTIPSNTEIVIIIADDIHDAQLTRLMHCLKAMPHTDHLSIEFSKRKNLPSWDLVFNSNGYSSPPRWREGLIANLADSKTLEEQRLAELAAIEETRTAYVDPALRGKSDPKLSTSLAAKLSAVEVIDKYKPKPPVPPAPPVKRGGPPKGSARPGHNIVEPATPWAKELRDMRTALGISQGEMSRRMGTAQGVLSGWERGVSVPLWGYFLELRKHLPSLSEPPDIMGRKAFESGISIKRGKKGEKKSAKEAFGGEKAAANSQPVAPAPVVQAVRVERAVVAKAPPPPPPPAPAPVVAVAPPAPSPGDVTLVELRGGGTLTITVSVNLMKLRGEDRAFVLALTDLVGDYEEGKKK